MAEGSCPGWTHFVRQEEHDDDLRPLVVSEEAEPSSVMETLSMTAPKKPDGRT